MKNNSWQNEEKNWKIVRNRVCIRALLIFLGIVLMQVLAYMICAVGTMVYATVSGRDALLLFAQMAGTEMSGIFVMWVSLVSALLSMIWCGVLYKKSDWRTEKFDYKKAFSPKNILAVCGVGIGGCLVLTMLLSFLAMLIPQAFTAYNTMMEGLTDSSMLVTIIYVLLVGPISEELIFRGAILDRFYLAFPFLIANVLQAALFGLYHMNLIQGLYAFCLGFVLGLIRHVTGSILASMLSHILFNATSYGLDLFLPTGEDMQIWKIVLLVITGLAFCILGVKYLWKGYQEKEVSQ